MGLVRIYVLAYQPPSPLEGEAGLIPASWLWDDPDAEALLYVQREPGDHFTGPSPLYLLLCELYHRKVE